MINWDRKWLRDPVINDVVANVANARFATDGIANVANAINKKQIQKQNQIQSQNQNQSQNQKTNPYSHAFGIHRNGLKNEEILKEGSEWHKRYETAQRTL